MTLSHLFYAYVLGGCTFLPLLLFAILLPAWWLAPQVPPSDNAARKSSVSKQTQAEAADDDESKELDEGGNGAASATFAVLRAYEFQAATAALNARAGSSAANRDASHDGSIETSESVYQTMYRSVFDRNKNASNPILDRDEEPLSAAPTIKKKPVSVSVFYIVLRHGCLMLYDSVAQLEVRHVISLALHDVSLSEGHDDETLIDGDLFVKRTAIVLTPHATSKHHSHNGRSPAKPYYLFSSNCAEKEDFYHALLASRTPPPVPLSISAADAIKLQSSLHSSSLTPETRALNALLGRVFLALHRTPQMESLIRHKIEKKMSRISRPSFIASLSLNAVDLGDAGPIISNLRLKEMNISGDTTIALDIRYNGAVKVAISAQAKIDLGSRFKTRTVDLVLATSLQRLHGHMLVRIKPPPSNRIWFCFESPPEMDIKVEPIVSQRQITYTFILRAIEERIRAVVAETLVKPNWDDVPFFNTESQQLRGGIWKDERANRFNENDDADSSASPPEHDSTTSLLSQFDISAPDFDAASTAASIASGSQDALSSQIKRRSVSSVSTSAGKSESDVAVTTGWPRSLRSPSLTSPSPSLPSVSTEGATMSAAKPGESTIQPRGWRLRAGQQLPSRREAVEAVREMRDRAFMHLKDEHSGEEHDELAEYDGESITPPPETAAQGHRRHSSATSSSSVKEELDDILPPNRSATSASPAIPLNRSKQQRKNILAATAAATNAARNWSWNAISSRGRGTNGHLDTAQHGSVKHQPMGRGQPLPPPGVPLPGPQKSLWSSTGLGSVRRKPIPALPPRSPAHTDDAGPKSPAAPSSDDTEVAASGDRNESAATTSRASEDEFGPWNENSGLQDSRLHDGPHFSDGERKSASHSRRTPPPLPARPTAAKIAASVQDLKSELVTYEHDDIPSGQAVLPSDANTNGHSVVSTTEDSFKGGRSIDEEAIEADVAQRTEYDMGSEAKSLQDLASPDSGDVHADTLVTSLLESDTNGVTAIEEPADAEVHGENEVTVHITDVVQEDEDDQNHDAIEKSAEMSHQAK